MDIIKLEYQIFSILKGLPVEERKKFIHNILKICDIPMYIVYRGNKNILNYRNILMAFSRINKIINKEILDNTLDIFKFFVNLNKYKLLLE